RAVRRLVDEQALDAVAPGEHEQEHLLALVDEGPVPAVGDPRARALAVERVPLLRQREAGERRAQREDDQTRHGATHGAPPLGAATLRGGAGDNKWSAPEWSAPEDRPRPLEHGRLERLLAHHHLL